MDWFEMEPLPEICKNCKEEECWECDHAGERWILTEVHRLELRRVGLLKAVERLNRQIKQLDKDIEIATQRANDRTRASWQQFKRRMKEEQGIDFDAED